MYMPVSKFLFNNLLFIINLVIPFCWWIGISDTFLVWMLKTQTQKYIISINWKSAASLSTGVKAHASNTIVDGQVKETSTFYNL